MSYLVLETEKHAVEENHDALIETLNTNTMSKNLIEVLGLKGTLDFYAKNKYDTKIANFTPTTPCARHGDVLLVNTTMAMQNPTLKHKNDALYSIMVKTEKGEVEVEFLNVEEMNKEDLKKSNDRYLQMTPGGNDHLMVGDYVLYDHQKVIKNKLGMAIGERFMTLNQTSVLTHRQHKTFVMPAGNYEIRYQHQPNTAGDLQRVRD